MKFKKWLIMFFCTIIGIVILISRFNLAIDSFGDKYVDLHPYEFTKNSRTAKIANLDSNNKEYDSHIVGRLATSYITTEILYKGYAYNPENYTAEVPAILYHHLLDAANGTLAVTEEVFESHIEGLVQAGYSGVSIGDLIEYTNNGVELPEKPILITFDDGYLSNYEIAYPILKKYNMKATIFVIGSSVGKDKYKDTEYEIYEHFTHEEGKEMLESGLIEIQSHTFDMHQWGDYETGQVRPTILKIENETEEEYALAVTEDILKSKNDIENNIGGELVALAYPLGRYDALIEGLLSDLGINVTLSTEHGMNTVTKGLPQSLQALKRYAVPGEMTSEELIEMINGKSE